jgi:hypothetical protein
VLVGIDNFYSLFEAGEDAPGKKKEVMATNNGSFQPGCLSRVMPDKRDPPIRLYKKDTGT